MNKLTCLLSTTLIGLITVNVACATNLIEVYREALLSDPTYQQALQQRLSDRENVPISLAGLLPAASINATPNISRSVASGSATIPGTDTAHGYIATLNLSQTIFDFGKFAAYAGSKQIAKKADANLSAATQELMIRVSKAYFMVLQDQDNLIYIRSTRTAYGKQLDQVKQQFKVGLKTVTDVYTARASYESSVASYIAAENTLANDKENLRAITGILYPSYARLSESFPLISPHPADMDAWVTAAGQQNWSIKSAQYAAEAARDTIKQQYAGNLPSLNALGSYQDSFSHNSGPNGFSSFASGIAKIRTASAQLSLNIPLVQGGEVIAQTHQAQYNYQVALEQLEYQLRSTLTLTRQSYLGVMSGISKIAADRDAIKSAISSLHGMEAGYRVGTEILVNVLNQQQNVFQAQEQYASDRYAYVNNLLALKQAAGTLSQDDLMAINSWLQEDNAAMNAGPYKTTLHS